MKRENLDIIAEDTLWNVKYEVRKALHLLDGALDNYLHRHDPESEVGTQAILWDFERYKSYIWAAQDVLYNANERLKEYEDAHKEMKKPLTDDQINSAAGQKPDITDSIHDVS